MNRIMKTWLCGVLAFILLIAPMPAEAVSIDFLSDDQFGYYLYDNGDVFISDYHGEEAHLTIPATFNGKPITGIVDRTFTHCQSLISVTISEGIVSMGEEAFYRCENLQSVSVPNSLKSIGKEAFALCKSLTEITLPNVSVIGDCAFSGCQQLSRVTLPKNMKSIGSYAFDSCINLVNITIPEGVAEIADGMLYGCIALERVEIGRTVTSIGDLAFADCSSLQEVEIPDRVTSIGREVFDGCSSLQRITVDGKNTVYCSIDGCLYTADKTKLLQVPTNIQMQKLTIPESVVEIGDSALAGCVTLSEVVIPDGVMVIGHYAFSGCSKLEEMNLPEHALTIGAGALNGTPWYAREVEKDEKGVEYIGPHLITVNAEKLTGTYTVREGTVSIAAAAFAPGPACHNPSRLTGLVLPNSLEVIETDAFWECDALHSITFGKKVTQLPEGFFSAVRNIQELVIPSGFTNVDALRGLPKTVHVFFSGTGEQWKQIGGTETYVSVHYNAASAADVLPGDVDGDGQITSTDARLVLQFYVGKARRSTADLLAADVDGTGYANSTDARIILQYYAGKISEWP